VSALASGGTMILLLLRAINKTCRSSNPNANARSHIFTFEIRPDDSVYKHRWDNETTRWALTRFKMMSPRSISILIAQRTFLTAMLSKVFSTARVLKALLIDGPTLSRKTVMIGQLPIFQRWVAIRVCVRPRVSICGSANTKASLILAT